MSMMPPRMTEDDVGTVYRDPAGRLWQLVSYSDKPTATVERLYTTGDVERQIPRGDTRKSGVVGSSIFAGLERVG